MIVAELIEALEAIGDKAIEVRAILNYRFTERDGVNRGIHAVYQYDNRLWLSEKVRIDEDVGAGSLVLFAEGEK